MALITEAVLRAMVKKGIPNPYPFRENDKITPAAMDYLKGRGIQLEMSKLSHPSQREEAERDSIWIPVGVSNRHVHLSPQDVDKLFGTGYSLTPMRPLTQPGQFAAQEQVSLLGPKGVIQGVRILGPARGESQVEISRTDGFQLGIHPPIRISGDTEGTPGLTIVGPKGCVTLGKGAIIAKCHVHLSVEEAASLGVKQGDSLILQTAGERSLSFLDVPVRVDRRFALDFHIDMDEANAANLNTGDRVRIIGKNGELFPRSGR